MIRRDLDTKSGRIINEGCVHELEALTPICKGDQTQCTRLSRHTSEEDSDQSADAPVTDVPVKMSQEKREKTQTPCSNFVFRKNMLKTILVLWSAACMGCGYVQIGPTLPDLQDLVGVSLKQGSWLFSGFAIGYLAGCLLGGIVLSKFNANFVLFLSTLLAAISITLLPWVPVFPVMVFIRVLTGLGVGVQDTGNLSVIFRIWADKAGPYNQMNYVMISLGGIAAPLVTKPFLMKVTEEDQIEVLVFNTTPRVLNVSVNITFDNTTNTEQVAMDSTRVHCALLITGLLYLSVVLPFLFAFLKDNQAKVNPKTKAEMGDNHVEKKLPKHVERIVLILILLNSFIATACFDIFPSFLTIFLIKQLNWSRQDGSTLTSLFFVLFGVGNFINIFGSIYINPTKIMVFSFMCCIVTFAGILLSIVLSNTNLIWATISLAGLAASNVVPVLYVWTQEYVTPVTSSIASALLVSGSLGMFLNPLLVGYMMDEYSPMWFMYLSFGDVVCCASLFFIAMVFVKIYTINTKTGGNEIEVSHREQFLSERICAEKC